jgi:transcriptional regulator with XRE-family HTH domain
MPNILKRLRERKGITISDLSDRVNMAGSTLSRMENGKQSIYDSQAIILADFFNVSIDHLLGRE